MKISSKILLFGLVVIFNFTKCSKENVKTVKIGKQVWMAEDLKTTRYNNGDQILQARLPEEWESYCKNQTGCYRILNNGAFVYNGFAIADSRGILPDSFALPEWEDFNELRENLGGTGDGCGNPFTKSMATYTFDCTQWDEKNNRTTEVKIKGIGNSGFNAKEGGFVLENGKGNEGKFSIWWTSSFDESGLNLHFFAIGDESVKTNEMIREHRKRGRESNGFAVRGLKKTNDIIQNQRYKLIKWGSRNSPFNKAMEAQELLNSIIGITGADFNQGTSVTGMVKGEAVMAIIPDKFKVKVIVKYRYLTSSGIEEAQEEGILENFRITSDGPNNTKVIYADWNNQDAYAGDGIFTFRLYSEEEPQTIIAQIDSKNGGNWYHSAWIELSNDEYKKVIENTSLAMPISE